METKYLFVSDFFVNMACKPECVRNLKTYGILITVNKLTDRLQNSNEIGERQFLCLRDLVHSFLDVGCSSAQLSEWPWICYLAF